MKTWRIRPAGDTDKFDVVALEAAAFGLASWGAAGVADGFAERGVNALLATDDESERPQGFAFWRAAGEEAEILTIGVDPRVRRAGCAKALLEAIISAAREVGVRRLFLEVDVANNDAVALYRGRGFEQVGRRKRYYKNGDDALVMRLDL